MLWVVSEFAEAGGGVLIRRKDPVCQTLDRTQPSLPIKPGRGRTMTHDYKRNGTVDPFAAMNVATGEVLHDTRSRHAGDDVLAFFKLIDAHLPCNLAVHVLLDNLSAHKAEPVREWLAHPRRKRWHLHFTPTSASWLNLMSVNRRVVLGVDPQGVEERQLRIRGPARERYRPAGITLERQPSTVGVDQTADDIITKVKRGRATLTALTESRRPLAPRYAPWMVDWPGVAADTPMQRDASWPCLMVETRRERLGRAEAGALRDGLRRHAAIRSIRECVNSRTGAPSAWHHRN
jgi:transposase